MAKFQKGQSGNPATMFKPGNTASKGKGKRVCIGGIPKDAQAKVYAALFHALTLPDKDTADKYLRAKADELPEYGYLIQVYAKGMMGKFGTDVAEKVMDRLFGKARQTTDFNLGAQRGTGLNIVVGDKEAADALRKVISTGAAPADPDPGEADPDTEVDMED